MLDTAFRALMSPVLMAQAMRVRRTAQSLPEAAGPREGTFGAGPVLRLTIIGDSSAAGVGVARQSEALSGQLVNMLGTAFTVQWHLDALTGATTRSTIARLQLAQSRPGDVVITALGVNDVTRLIPAATWVRQQNTLFDRVQHLYQPRQIYVTGMAPLGRFPLLPDPLRWTLGRHADRLERQREKLIATRNDCTLVPFNTTLDSGLMATDGFHPGPNLYALWAKEMASRIISDWPKLR
ncbi:Lipolytic enzyme, G-D-S-L [Sulfitobacter noctilucae]|uniref:SGNH/GDSL hydrolase family protein n=1 Tax=Sulfitobacter noctilucae TaxID=1342302 RepID=UPI00069A58D1|nr:SGNH/GDSL hydrolase family protein [Sulfitobacter noctilucae]KIN70834.1 Lipolytic enzyme, G-D-S-L [Sulfitobacter noctilucae]